MIGTTLSFSFEDIAKAMPPGMALPNGFVFSPDNTSIYYMKSKDVDSPQGIFSFNLKTLQETVVVEPPAAGKAPDDPQKTHADELRRQRLRQSASGITSFQTDSAGRRVIYPFQGDIYALDRPGAVPRKIFASGDGSPAESPRLSPDGNTVAFVRDGQLMTVPYRGHRVRRLTRGTPIDGITFGQAEYIVQEEFHRAEGFWWSPDSRQIALIEVDERHIPPYRIAHQGKHAASPSHEEAHRYPFAGRENAHVRLGVIPAAGGKVTWLYDTRDDGGYLAQVFWCPDDRYQGQLCIELISRDQTRIDLIRIDPKTGERTLELRQEAENWINLEEKHLVPSSKGQFLWLSEQTGFAHVALHDPEKQRIRSITSGEWVVDAIKSVDEEHNLVYLTGNLGDPTQRHLFAVSLKGKGNPRRITPEDGTHLVTLDRTHRYFVDVWSALDQPPRVRVRDLTNSHVIAEIPTPTDPRIDYPELVPPEIVTLKNRAGTTLYGALYRPPAQLGGGPFPLVVEVYGGPGPQMVVNNWSMTALLRLHYLRQMGFAVFKLDNRGSARRGMAFESAIKRRMGTVEVEDQVDGVNWLVQQGIADPKRVGITGWSYGGYMTLMCLAKAPETFQVGVAGAPVTDWDGYDTAYTERYMSTPAENAEGYLEGSVLTHADKIAGKLLIIHGMLDENVHFRHTARLIDRLNERGFDYDVLILPGERHMLRDDGNRKAQLQRTFAFLKKHLLD